MDSSSHSRRHDLDGGGGDDLEEGEYVPGRDESSDTDDDSGGYRFQPRREGEHGGRRMSLLEEVVASGRVALRSRLVEDVMASRRVAPPRSLTPSSCESDGTISDDGGDPSAASSVISPGAPARRFACNVCGKRFVSPKAVDGHMRVHGNGRQVVPVVSGGWAATGKRGWTGGKPSLAVSLNSESTDHSTAAIVAVRPFEPMPMAILMTSLSSTPGLSTRTNLSGEESSSASEQLMHHEAVATGSSNPSSTGAVVHPQAAPPPAAEQARPAVHQPAVPPPAAQQQAQFVLQPLVPPPARPAQPPREYSCKLCGKSYSTHQGLGGHAAGHRNRQKEAEAAAAASGMMAMGQDGGAFLASLRRGRKAEAPHECQKCHKVFATGVALGGHMRMHYTGPPIVHKKNKKRCLAPPPARTVSEADLRLALSTVTVEQSPAPAPVAGRVRLFGIDINLQVQAPSEHQESGTPEGSSSAGEQQ